MRNLVSRLRFEMYRFWYKHIKNSVVQTEYMNCKILVRANEDVGLQILVGNYEKNDLLYLLSMIRDGDTFFDIGANIGLFSLLVAKKNCTVKVHSFEPIPINSCLFKASLCLNEIESVNLNQCCVGDFVGDIEFSLASDSAYSSIHDTGRFPEIKKIKAKITTLDEYLKMNDLTRIDIMKIDVEGAEKLVLDGARNILSNNLVKPRLVLMELFDKNFDLFGTSIDDVVNVMKLYKYKAFVIDGNDKSVFCPRHYNKIYNVFFELEGNDGVKKNYERHL
ncbi:FkbM family methyltransferase [Thiovibrio frasassiensis]|uniref:FkbM family methyltransferase n=1 Tax=Thiovibrio frasassiensis TaxID=2984131 RepID=A0A9X4MF16_9BACT|nr:FkbM family methyltransferase [Thiovibrio frasassiensis]MDG4476041.1 FkbM family methyltransferase [Thiovibrio frasassiensis]